MKQLDDFPAFKAAAEKLAEVQTQHRAAIAERAELLATIEGTRGRAESLADQAQRVLEGDASIPADLGTLRAQFERAGRQVALLAEVERLARQNVENERARASEVICTEARPKFAALVSAELRAAHALLTAQQARREFWQTLNDTGVSMAHLPPVADLVKGTINDPNAMIWQRVADAERLGYIAADAFTRPAPAPDRDSALNRAGLRLLAAGPAGIGTVETVGDGRTRPVAGQWHATPSTPKAANGWGDAA